MLFGKKEKNFKQDSVEKSEKQSIKRLEEQIEYVRTLYSEEIEEEDSLVKVCVASRNAKGHLQNLGSFFIPEDSIDSLQEEIKVRYGPGRYCVSLEKGEFRSRGVDIPIAGYKRSQAEKQTPYEQRLILLAQIMAREGLTHKDSERWLKNYWERGDVLLDEDTEQLNVNRNDSETTE